MSVPVLLLVTFLVCSAHGHDSDSCVTEFYEFEKATVNDNPSNVDALVKAFYKPNKPTPLSVQIVYHVNFSNGTDTIVSTDPNCSLGNEIWLWLPSPVFIFIEPSKLNWCALLTLYYFQPWIPHQADIHVPNICNVSTSNYDFNFLNDFTSRVSSYNWHTYSDWCAELEDLVYYIASARYMPLFSFMHSS